MNGEGGVELNIISNLYDGYLSRAARESQYGPCGWWFGLCGRKPGVRGSRARMPTVLPSQVKEILT